MRRKLDIALGILAVAIFVAGLLAWSLTGNLEHFYGGIFFAIFPLIWLLYFHFYLLSAKRTPEEIEKRLSKLGQKQQKAARQVGRFNGWMMMLASPILLLLGIGTGAEESGFWGALRGILPGLFFFIAGLACVLWARRQRKNSVIAQGHREP